MSVQYVLALDQGTTSSRAILFEHDGKIAGVAQHEFEQHYSEVGWVEHDPYEILTSQLKSAVEVLRKAKICLRDIVALGITNQRETTIVWNRESGNLCIAPSFGRIAAAHRFAKNWPTMARRKPFARRRVC